MAFLEPDRVRGATYYTITVERSETVELERDSRALETEPYPEEDGFGASAHCGPGELGLSLV